MEAIIFRVNQTLLKLKKKKDSGNFFWFLFPSVGLPCPVSMGRFLFDFIISYFAMFGCYLLETCSFLRRNSRGVDPKGRGNGKELGGGNCNQNIFKKKKVTI